MGIFLTFGCGKKTEQAPPQRPDKVLPPPQASDVLLYFYQRRTGLNTLHTFKVYFLYAAAAEAAAQLRHVNKLI